MGKRDAKLDAIRAVLRRAGRPLTLNDMLPRVETRMRQIIGRGRLYNLLAQTAGTGEITITGRGRERAYGLKRSAA